MDIKTLVTPVPIGNVRANTRRVGKACVVSLHGCRLIILGVLVSTLLSCSGSEPRPKRQDPQQQNPASAVHIDQPAPDRVVGPTTVVAGWAFDESGVQRVRIYADDRLLATVPLTIHRPDVEKEFPQATRPGAVHGWEAEVDFGSQVGYCVIRAEALDGRGALTRGARVTVRIQP